jgi:hypothetical protein
MTDTFDPQHQSILVPLHSLRKAVLSCAGAKRPSLRS